MRAGGWGCLLVLYVPLISPALWIAGGLGRGKEVDWIGLDWNGGLLRND